VDCATSDNTAKANTNYMPYSSTLHFHPGETLKSITIPILRDYIVTGPLSFWVALSNPQGQQGSGDHAIHSECDHRGRRLRIRFQHNSFSVLEGGSVAWEPMGRWAPMP